MTFSHPSCDSRLNQDVLAAVSLVSLVWPVTLAHHLVHLGNIIRRTVSSTLHSTSTQKRLAINYSSSLIIKPSSLPGRTRGLMPSTRIVHGPDSSWDCRRVLHRISAFITMYSTLQVLQRGHFSSYARFENCSLAFNSAVSLFVVSDSRRCLTCLFRQARHHLFALNIKANFILLCIGPRHATLSCLTRGLLSLYHNKDFYHSIKESHLWNLHCLLNCLLNCMSGWYLALHRHWHLNDSIDDSLRDTILGMIWTTSTTTFHNLWYGSFVNLPHRLLRNPFLKDHFATSHNPLLDLRDCHVHNSFNGALLKTLQWDQSHTFTDLLHDLRNILSRHQRLAVWTQHRRSSFLRTSINSRFIDILYIHTGNLYNGLRCQNCETSRSCSKLHPKHMFRNCLHPLGRSSTVLSSVHHFGCARHDASTCCARIAPVSPPPDVTRGDLQELQPPSQRTRSHVSNPVTAKNLSSTFVTTSSYAFMACLSFWPCSGCSS